MNRTKSSMFISSTTSRNCASVQCYASCPRHSPTSDPYMMLERIVPENNTGSCGTMLIMERMKSPVRSFTFTPSSNTSPLVTL